MNKNHSNGFSLLEVLIAVTIFLTFTTAFYVTRGQNKADSIMMREEITLQNLAESKINEIIDHPPELRDALTIGPENDYKAFDDYPDYEYAVKWKKIVIPDLAKIKGEEEETGGNDQSSSAMAIISKNIKENMEKLIWQVRVTIRNKETDFKYDLSTWVFNHKAKVVITNVN